MGEPADDLVVEIHLDEPVGAEAPGDRTGDGNAEAVRAPDGGEGDDAEAVRVLDGEEPAVGDVHTLERMRADVARLQSELEQWRHRAETAEALSEERGQRLEELRSEVDALSAQIAEPEVRYTVVRVPVSRDRIVSLDEHVPDDLRTPPKGWLRRMLGAP